MSHNPATGGREPGGRLKTAGSSSGPRPGATPTAVPHDPLVAAPALPSARATAEEPAERLDLPAGLSPAADTGPPRKQQVSHFVMATRAVTPSGTKTAQRNASQHQQGRVCDAASTAAAEAEAADPRGDNSQPQQRPAARAASATAGLQMTLEQLWETVSKPKGSPTPPSSVYS